MSRGLVVTLLSAATLAYEILLVRVFAIEHFYHLAYMAIGVAMLGFGAAGTLLALTGPIGRERATRGFPLSCLLAAAALIASPALIHQVPLDLTQLAWNPAQWSRLALVYLLLALPFGLGALAVLLALSLDPARPGLIYGASFLGSGLGAALAIVVLWWLLPTRALAVPAVVASVGAVAAARRTGVGWSAGTAWLLTVLAAMVILRPLWRLEVSPYKALPQVEAYPGARRVAERGSPLGWVVAVEAPAFHHAPGLSLGYAGPLPTQTALFVDGQIAGAASRGDDSSSAAILDWLPSALPYAVGRRSRVLVIGAGGGLEVWNAAQHGSQRITAVELNPDLVDVGLAISGPSARSAGVQWVTRDARSFVARSEESYDLISLGLEGGFGTAVAGVHALNEDFLHTLEAYEGYLHHLSEVGVLSLTRWLTAPPRSGVRMILTAAAALRRTRPEQLERGLVVARSWATVTVLVKPSGFRSEEIAALAAWARDRQFDLDWYPGIQEAEASFNLMAEPTLYEATAQAVRGAEPAAQFAAAYPFDVAPADDARPYPHHYLRARSLGRLFRSGIGNWLPFAEWGYIALLATLLQSLLLGGLVMALPVVVRSRAARCRGLPRLVGYFAAIGFGYLAAELAAIQQLGLLLGHPVYAVAAVLAGFLIASGAGSAWSDRWGAGRSRLTTIVPAVLLAICAAMLLNVVHWLEPSALVWRCAAALAVLLPLAFFMGMPFPTGLRLLTGGDTVRVAWAWAANGIASVVAAPLAALIALEAGSPALFLLAAAAYLCATVLGGRLRGARRQFT